MAAVSFDGEIVEQAGDVTRPFYFRSAAKPFQAAVSQRLGADLVPEQLAVASASHDGDPVHIALVEAMLASVGLSEADLRCPPSWPLSSRAASSLRTIGHRRPRRIWHNCSGKHAAMLRACLAQGWSPPRYLEPDHPLQREVASEMRTVAGDEVGPVGVDGCGVPVFRATTVSLARAFASLPGRHRDVWDAMHRYPGLVSGVHNVDSSAAVWLAAAAKRGAEACIGVSVAGRGGVGIKVWDGSPRAVGPALSAVLDRLGWAPPGTRARLAVLLEVPVAGGGTRVGSVRVRAPWT